MNTSVPRETLPALRRFIVTGLARVGVVADNGQECRVTVDGLDLLGVPLPVVGIELHLITAVEVGSGEVTHASEQGYAVLVDDFDLGENERPAVTPSQLAPVAAPLFTYDDEGRPV